MLGDGPTTLLLVTGWVLPMEAIWEDPAYVRFVERLASSFRVILWDKRGTGLSDRVAVDRLPTLEERMDDIGAVLDAAGAERAAIAGLSEGAVLAALFGAAHPERTRALALYGGWLAANIPGAEYVELAGDDHLWWLGDQDALLDEIERFLVGAAPAREPDRVLATVLFTAGSGIAFEDRGTHDLRGVADDWHLYALASA